MALIVITVVPNSSGAGVTVKVRAEFVPTNTILVLGTKVGLDELPDTISFAVVSSCRSKLIAPVLVSSLMVRLLNTVTIRGGRSNAAVA